MAGIESHASGISGVKFVSCGQPPAIEHQDMPVNVVARSGTEKEGCTAEIRRLAPTAGRNTTEDLAAADRVAAKGLGVVGHHITGGNGIHFNPFGSPFVR